MLPVNPRALEALGRGCFTRLLDIQPTIDAALLITSPAVTEAEVEDCAQAGILWVWMYRAAGQGGVVPKPSSSAVRVAIS
jgi:predicted CoA-binding protein